MIHALRRTFVASVIPIIALDYRWKFTSAIAILNFDVCSKHMYCYLGVI